jgi:hypothetical protein
MRAEACSGRAGVVRRGVLVCLLAGVGVFVSGVVALRAQVIERVLAVVDGRVITLLDVQAARTLGLVDTSGSHDPAQAAVSQLIDRTLVLDEVDRFTPRDPDPAAVEAGVAAVRRRFASDAAFNEALAATGMEVFAVRQWVRNDLRIQAYLDQRFAAAGDPAADHYEDHRRQTVLDLGDQEAAPPSEALDRLARDRVAAERREALIRQWVDALRARARISLPSP